MALQVLGTTRGVEVTSSMVADMITTCATWDVCSLADLSAARSEATSTSDQRMLAEAEKVARALGHLPEVRPAVDGVRVPPVPATATAQQSASQQTSGQSSHAMHEREAVRHHDRSSQQLGI